MRVVSCDDQVKAYIKKIMSQLNKWMLGNKISKLVVVITSKENGENVERWQFDVRGSKFTFEVLLTGIGFRCKFLQVTIRRKCLRRLRPKRIQLKCMYFIGKTKKQLNSRSATESYIDKSEKDIQAEIQSIFRQITASVTFLPLLDGNCTFNVLVYADANSEVPLEWGDSDAREVKNAEKVQLRSFSTTSHKIDTLVSYR